MKKSILVVFPGPMEIGGIEKSLVGLLSSFNFDKYDVDLFLYGHFGPLYNLIDPRVNILPEIKELAYLRSSLKEKLKHRCFYSAIIRLRDQIKSLFGSTNNDISWAKVMRHCTKKQEKNYDLALSFFLPFDYLNEMVTAKIKIGWIHTDYFSETSDFLHLCNQYQKVDLIAAVSEACGNHFASIFPELTERIFTMENILPTVLVRGQAEEFTPADMDHTGLKLLSIGRFCTAKNFDNVPDICRRLLEQGVDVKWYLIGFGGDEELIRQKISETHMEQHVIVLGKKENPYPYIRACDLYVQPSRYEGKAVTVREAQMLGKPVVITNYATSGSQLEDGVDGVVVPMDNEGCAAGIAALLRDPERMRRLSKTCKNRDYSNSAEVEKLYRLMEN